MPYHRKGVADTDKCDAKAQEASERNLGRLANSSIFLL